MLDNLVSKKVFGVDNETCPVYKSVSYWGMVALAIVVLVAFLHKLELFELLHQMPLLRLCIVVDIIALAYYTMARGKIADLFGIIPRKEVQDMLHSLSYRLTVITGLVYVALLFLVTFGIH